MNDRRNPVDFPRQFDSCFSLCAREEEVHEFWQRFRVEQRRSIFTSRVKLFDLNIHTCFHPNSRNFNLNPLSRFIPFPRSLKLFASVPEIKICLGLTRSLRPLSNENNSFFGNFFPGQKCLGKETSHLPRSCTSRRCFCLLRLSPPRSEG